MDENGHLQAVRAALAHRYKVEREIGRGAFATVFLADDLSYQRQVAIKVLKPEWRVAVGRERFLLEIKLTAQLNHPHILSLLDSGDQDGFLYYVMPYVAGESLRQRLRRERQLPIEEAIRIAREVAEALAAAHALGVVHRDIKPENILLHAGHAMVADFGIAKALTVAGGESLTSAGLGVGTHGYMSPEQATGERNLDQRTDVYSLACVVYEMLVGEMPYTGPSSQAILAKQLGQPAPSARIVRETVPPALDEAIRRALAKAPADRFATVMEFAGALESARKRKPLDWLLWALRPRTATVVLGGVVVATVLSWVLSKGALNGTASGAAGTDTSRYVILPFDYDAGVTERLNEVQLLRDALSRWSGLSVADPLRVRDALGSGTSTPLSQPAAERVSRRLGAGRYLRGTVSRAGDSIRVEAGLYNTGQAGSLLAGWAVRFPQEVRGRDSLFAVLVDRLLLRGLLRPGDVAFSGTRSLPARQAFARGQQALDAWDLVRADGDFTAATVFDPAYAEGQMWAALVRAWSGGEPARFRLTAEQAALGRARLSSLNRAMTDALVAEARGDFGRACPLWHRLTETEPHEYAVWYGSAHCLRRDDIVVPDGTSRSGWRFRSSYQAAIRGYRRAFELHPAILSSFRGNAYEQARTLLMTSTTTMRPGRALEPDTAAFRARPVWRGDSLVLEPYPMAVARGPVAPWSPQSVRTAVQHQRELFRDIAVSWVTAFPQSAAAMEALAVSLEALGNPAAVDTLRRARSLAGTSAERTSAAAAEVWVQVKLGTASDPYRLRQARALADSLLGDSLGATRSPRALVGLAALTGRAALAASLARRAALEGGWAPPWLASTAPALLVFASLGGPVDSLQALEQRVVEQLQDESRPGREELKLEWLGRSARLAEHVWHFDSAQELLGKGDYLLDAQAAMAAGDTQAVRRTLSRLAESRKAVPPSDRAIDALYPEAALFRALHDDAGAIAWLEPTLKSLPQSEPGTFDDPARPGALVNAMALLADLTSQTGDRTGARRWAEVVSILWSDADDFLQPLVIRMRRLARL